jgi:hypothetical protein
VAVNIGQLQILEEFNDAIEAKVLCVYMQAHIRAGRWFID